MGKVAVIKIRSDDSKQGFLVSLQICQDDGLPLSEIEGARLPTHPDIESCYLMWQTFFRGLKVRGNDDWEIEPTFTQRSTIEGVDACREWVKSLETNMQDWLQKSSDRKWQQIREKLVGELAKNSQDVRVMIKAHPSLWKLPWHSWDLLKSYPDLGISFSPEDYNREEISRSKGSDNQVNILAILGDDSNIDLQPDRQVIANLKGAETEVLNKPTASDFIKKVRQESGWDILFFAGHSETKDNVGRIYISKDESLEIEQFKNALKSAINRGLKIAIFNSCEGLGLAEQIAKLQIPVAVFMQEKVPDRVAQSFLKEFLTEYANGQPLHTAFRRAQSRLEEFTTLPGATWLPKLYQNLGETPPTWEELRDKKKPDPLPIPPPSRPSKPKLQTVFIASFIVTSLVMGVRSIGWLQSWELQAYDAIMRMRSIQDPDERLLVVRITQEDMEQLGEKTLSDRTVAQLLAKLQQYKPQLIGLDIYRDKPVGKGLADLKTQLQQGQKIITVCKSPSDVETNKVGYQPPPGVPEERIGFSDFVEDKDGIIRRHLFHLNPEPSSPCKSLEALSTKLALNYLKSKGIVPDAGDFLKFRNVVFQPLEKNTGGYQQSDKYTDLYGHQVMLNYRPYHRFEDIAQSVTIMDVLNGDVKPGFVKDRIVLIGYDDDAFSTPYPASQLPNQKTPGVFIHAQMVSQIIDAALEKRSLIGFFPPWGDTLFVWSWSIVGGTIVWSFRKLIIIGITKAIALGLLYAVCWGILLIQSRWMPFIPSAFALVLTGGIAIVFTELKANKLRGEK
ncbi:CHASE2 domain-containing protein [Argonema antarcticum]|uniref:CHASE2 domain-containing protein n=1 Tax=Argonema antarcticum TaxID=2942763 RepID=UPI0020110D4E|nr:CHASE2 domain-containing protein [Argonema antarcticum]MCL1472880.1 CHASE2 domain-containing protein [Argonema antarcticum A004/B2]